MKSKIIFVFTYLYYLAPPLLLLSFVIGLTGTIGIPLIWEVPRKLSNTFIIMWAIPFVITAFAASVARNKRYSRRKYIISPVRLTKDNVANDDVVTFDIYPHYRGTKVKHSVIVKNDLLVFTTKGFQFSLLFNGTVSAETVKRSPKIKHEYVIIVYRTFLKEVLEPNFRRKFKRSAKPNKMFFDWLEETKRSNISYLPN